jgi:hypothetical protein
MKDTTREWLIRREKPIAVTFVVLVGIVAAIALPKEYMKYVIACIIVAIGVFVSWTRTQPAPTIANPQISPSIREHMLRVHVWYVRTTVVLCIGWIAAAQVVWSSNAERGKFYLVGLAGALVITLLASLIARPYLRCPQCRTNFRKERIAKLGRFSRDPRSAAELWDSCPQCGISFDTPYPR